MLEIVAGWEPREGTGYNVCMSSIHRHVRTQLPRFIPLMEKPLRYMDLYRRPHEERDGQLWCPISDAPLSTVFSNMRFLVPFLDKDNSVYNVVSDWVLYCDFSDMLFLEDPAKLFALADDRFAVMVVKHWHEPSETVKMDDQAQTIYDRKNWSSLVLWNLRHKANNRLTLDDVNERPGRDLHRFFWLRDHEIGELPPGWNHLVGVEPDYEGLGGAKPALLHYTLGIPTMPGYENGPWSQIWKDELKIMDATRGRLRA